jgi:phosphate:Na+ symporter
MAGSELLLTLLGAVALLLWGVRMVRTGMTRAFGGALRSSLGRASKSRLRAFTAGFGVTLALQSSTATALLIASFASRGLITLPAALAIMLGADVGMALVAQAFVLDVKWLWAPAMLIGLILFSASDTDRSRSVGRIAIGFALMLLALTTLSAVSDAMRESVTLKFLLSALGSEPLLAIVLAAMLTWLAHSSLAIVLFIMSLTASGLAEPRIILALVLGANIGGAIAPFAALTNAAAAARQVPLGNLIARFAVALLVAPFLSTVVVLLPSLGDSPAHQVLNAHALFNLTVALLFLPLLDQLARLTTLTIPQEKSTSDRGLPQHLDPSVLDMPSEALACAMRETLAVGNTVLSMLRRSLEAFEATDNRLIKEIESTDDEIDALHEAIKLYLIRASKAEMGDEHGRRYVEILTFITNLEHIGDIIDKNLMELAAKKIKKRYSFSPEGMDELKRFHGEVVDNMRLSLNVFATRDVTLARRLLSSKATMRAQDSETADRHFARLRDGRLESIETSSIRLDVIRDLKRINSHLTSAAYPILEAAGELRESRLRESTRQSIDTSARRRMCGGFSSVRPESPR